MIKFIIVSLIRNNSSIYIYILYTNYAFCLSFQLLQLKFIMVLKLINYIYIYNTESGQLYAWGYGKALGTKTRHVVSPKSFSLHGKDNGFVVSLVGGDSHSMVLYQNGVLYTWGNNYEVI